MTAAKVQLLGALTTVSHRHGRQSTTLVAWASLGAPLGVGGANCSSHDSDFLRVVDSGRNPPPANKSLQTNTYREPMANN